VGIAAILFAISAAGGLTMAIIRFSGKPVPPMGLALLHGALGAAGLVALIVAVLGGSGPSNAKIALAGFIVAALGGFALFSFHLRKKALPIPLVLVHGLVAVASFAILLLAILAVR
jgi:hypothetical protein